MRSERKNSPPVEGCPKGGVVAPVEEASDLPTSRQENGVAKSSKRTLKNYNSLPYNPKLKERAKELRKAGNLSEVLLWQQLKNGQFKGFDFDRQKIIGNYIVDFYCTNNNVVIEIDGVSHDYKVAYDMERDAFLSGLGLTVIHIDDASVKQNLAGVMAMLSNHPALRAPLHRRGISQRKPVWLRKKINLAENREMEDLLKGLNLNTVCQQASCPNISECFSKKQATFLIMGKECTRKCTFCNISQEMPSPLDSGEPKRVAEAVIKLNLSHVVITSPTRDDLTDGGAAHFAITVDAIRSDSINTKIELLIPDFGGNIDSLKTVLSSQPDIIAHNIETVPRLYKIRNGADYKRSLDILRRSKTMAPEIPCKSGIMLGLGEKEDEIIDTIRDIAETGCDYLSIGQYLPPSKAHTPVMEFITPAKFAEFKGKAMTLGFEHVESAPYVRSSYHAKQYGKADN